MLSEPSSFFGSLLDSVFVDPVFVDPVFVDPVLLDPSVDDLVQLGFARRPALDLVQPAGVSHRLYYWGRGPDPDGSGDLAVEDLAAPLVELGLGRLLPSADAAAVVSVGRLRHVAGSDLRRGARVTVLQQVGGNADVLTAVHSERRVIVVPRADGRQADVLLRMLGLPTSPPEWPPTWFWLVAWLLDAVIDGTTSDFRRVAGCHPAIEPVELACVGREELVDFVVQRHRDHAATVGWSGLWQAALNGRLELGSVDAALASWLDVGSFARLVDERLGSAEALARLVHRSFPSDVVDVISEIVSRLAPP